MSATDPSSSRGVQERLDRANMLARRLERISVDSLWARRSSGARGNLIRLIEYLEENRYDLAEDPQENLEKILEDLESVMRAGYALLERAAREIPEQHES